jgi:hypothetical protein
MLILINAAVKLKKEGGIRQVGRFNFYSNKISFNSAAALLTPLTHKPKSKTPLRPKKNLDGLKPPVVPIYSVFLFYLLTPYTL